MTTFEKLQLDEMITQMVVYLITNIKKKKDDSNRFNQTSST